MARVERNSPLLQRCQLSPIPLENYPTERQAEENIATETEDAVNGQSLLPSDGGLAAWRMLIGAFIYEAILWGTCIQLLYIVPSNKFDQAFRSPLEYFRITIRSFRSSRIVRIFQLWEVWPLDLPI